MRSAGGRPVPCIFFSETMRTLFRVLTPPILFFASSSCWLWRGPTEEECAQVHVNNLRLLANDETMPEEMKRMMIRTVADPQRQKAMIESCMEKKTLKQIRCEMAAQSFIELTKCSPQTEKPKIEEKK